jgi:glycosyltransferase involved in cell wall biosynthesis
MNITVYSHYFHPEIGAPSARISELARQWINQGNSVQVVTGFPNHPGGKIYPGYTKNTYLYESIDGIDVHRHWTYITPNEGVIKRTLGHISFLPSALFISNRKLQKPDIVIGTSPTLFAAHAAAKTGKRRDVPFIMEVRDLWPAIFVELGILKNKYLIRALERWEMSLYRKASRIVTVTEAFRHNLIERGISPEKIVTIPNGADIDFWTPIKISNELRHKLNIDGKFIVLYIGAHGISHALIKIIDSAEKLKEEKNILFLFVGEGAEKKKLIEYANSKGLENIRFHEPVDKNTVKEFYDLADVCLVPLRNIPLFDSFIPSKMFEIMAMEKPIIGSVRGEPADILKKSQGALVVEPENSTQISEAIYTLYKDRSIGIEIGKKGHEFVKRFYSRTVLAEKYTKVLSVTIKNYNNNRP